ncbi:MAG: hypothetical protein ACR2QC_07890 [Gammaproteobacteria bacterium]
MQKPGLKTSEFGAVLLYALIIVVNGSDVVNIPWDILGEMVIPITSYIGGRSLLKASSVFKPSAVRVSTDRGSALSNADR